MMASPPIVSRAAAAACALLATVSLHAENEPIAFDSDRWQLTGGRIVTHLDRQTLAGPAFLKDVQFENGVIEVDIAVTGERSYPGITFHMRGPGNHEEVYVRPHRAGLYPDAVQYTPVFNGIGSWQLYSGEGFTAPAEIPTDEWVKLKLEVKGTQARVFLGESDLPVLVVNELKHGPGVGTIGLTAPADRTAYFSNFRYRSDDGLVFDPPPQVTPPMGMIRQWEISQAFEASQLDLEQTPNAQGLADITWTSVEGEPGGLVDIGRHVGRTGGPVDCVYARTTLHADADELRTIGFGYSDAVVMFLNGQIVFLGNSAYRQRDPSFLGIVGLNDNVYLPLKKGDNELLLAVVESFGGWGFMCQDGSAVIQHERLTKAWELRRTLRYPESVVYDQKRGVMYASNFYAGGREFLSKISLDGRIEELQWVSGLSRPTGLCIHEDRLFAVDRTGLVEIDIDTAQIAARHPVPEARFINDVAFDEAGAAYITDSAGAAIHRLHNGEAEVWLEGEAVSDPNGICVVGDEVVFGNSGDGSLKAVNLHNKSVRTIVSLGPGSIVDGIRPDGEGGFIISDFNGRVFAVAAEGEMTELLNTTVRNEYCADLEYIPDRGLLVIPSLYDNRIVAYEVAQ
ncbi:MAG: SMP-30/gluconolactonase/LRE family protein [Phycisphaerales bacterium]|nr:MAG: SMP-30/gluconolactonase/LRE family protein [Phycisphaerales bacterium]